jgi:riboflavin biosynthesis pyrimidine reductase
VAGRRRQPGPQFLAADLLDELIITVAPTFVGQGPSLADGPLPLRRFRLVSVDRAEDTEGVAVRFERDRARG